MRVYVFKYIVSTWRSYDVPFYAKDFTIVDNITVIVGYIDVEGVKMGALMFAQDHISLGSSAIGSSAAINLDDSEIVDVEAEISGDYLNIYIAGVYSGNSGFVAKYSTYLPTTVHYYSNKWFLKFYPVSNVRLRRGVGGVFAVAGTYAGSNERFGLAVDSGGNVVEQRRVAIVSGGGSLEGFRICGVDYDGELNILFAMRYSGGSLATISDLAIGAKTFYESELTLYVSTPEINVYETPTPPSMLRESMWVYRLDSNKAKEMVQIVTENVVEQSPPEMGGDVAFQQPVATTEVRKRPDTDLIKQILGLEAELFQGVKEALKKANMGVPDIREGILSHNITSGYARKLSVNGSGEVATLATLVYRTNNASLQFHLKGLIARNIPLIPPDSEAYRRLIELYGSQLERYPTISGRLQLLYAMMIPVET